MDCYENNSARVARAPEPLDDDLQRQIDAVMRGRPPLLLFTTLARDRRLFTRFFGSGLLDRGHLTLREREIVIDRVTATCGAEYEWGVHVTTFADKAGLDATRIASLLRGDAADECWNERERALIRACDSLHETCDIDGSLWSELRSHFSPEAAIEILMLAGFYRTVSYLVRGLRLPLEHGATRFADV